MSRRNNLLDSLPTFISDFMRRGRNIHCTLPTHDSMLFEHEKRKGEELRHQLEHRKRFINYLYLHL